MSFLTILFGLGALAVGFPLLFHLIRRTPKGRQPFSSLMFLDSSPPRLTRRSRIDEWLLLLIRAAVLALLAVAFMRPFLRDSALLGRAELPARRVAILLDTSASMRRAGVWDDAGQQLAQKLNALSDQDDFALWLFDEQVRTLVEFDNLNERRPLAEKKALAQQLVTAEQPSWKSTRLASALLTIAEMAEEVSPDRDITPKMQVFVISDLQQGAEVDSLQGFTWPETILVEFASLHPKQSDNATARFVQSSQKGDSSDTVRVRIANSNQSVNEQFRVTWSNGNELTIPDPETFFVPVGKSRTFPISVPGRRDELDRIVVSGDQVDFDNVYFTAPLQKRTLNVAYFGDEREDDAEAMLFFLKKALVSSPTLSVRIEQAAGGKILFEGAAPNLMVVTRELAESEIGIVTDFLKQGGEVLLVLAESTMTENATGLMSIPVSNRTLDSNTSKYRLLIDLDFTNDLLQPFAAPQFNDFTKIRFWRTTRVEFNESQVTMIARFDDQTPALWQTKIGLGTLVCLAASWRPADSQLALSSKFLPILNQLVERTQRGVTTVPSILIGDEWELPKLERGASRVVVRPDGVSETLAGDATHYSKTDMPGLYQFRGGEVLRQFAVNLDATESDLEPMPVEQLKNLGVPIGTAPSIEQELSELQKLKDQEIEGRQKVWKWLIVVVIGLVLGESAYLALKTSSRQTSSELTSE